MELVFYKKFDANCFYNQAEIMVSHFQKFDSYGYKESLGEIIGVTNTETVVSILFQISH